MRNPTGIPTLVPAAPKLRGALKATADNIRRKAVGLYEDLVWKVAEQDINEVEFDTETFGLLHAAEKTSDDFVSDVDKIRKRIALQQDIEDYRAANDELEALKEQKQALDEEYATELEHLKATHEENTRSLRKEIAACDARRKEANASGCVGHYRSSAPNWLRERLAELRKEHDRVLLRAKDTDRNGSWREISVELIQQIDDIRNAMLLLRPTPRDLKTKGKGN